MENMFRQGRLDDLNDNPETFFDDHNKGGEGVNIMAICKSIFSKETAVDIFRDVQKY